MKEAKPDRKFNVEFCHDIVSCVFPVNEKGVDLSGVARILGRAGLKKKVVTFPHQSACALDGPAHISIDSSNYICMQCSAE